MIVISPLAKLKLGSVDPDATSAPEVDAPEATLETLDTRIGGMEQRLEELENLLQALASKLGAEISH